MVAAGRIPRPEYPRPQMVREQWLNLNGSWGFEIDQGKSGRARKLYEAQGLNSTIIVPFCPESRLSGVEHKDFMASVWYRREFTLPEEWHKGHILLHFGAVDYYTEVWINGFSAGIHRGGYTSFSFDITDLLKPGSNVVTVCAEDNGRSGLQPRGKQSSEYHSHGCDYTRTTGIWQTVWLEYVPDTYIKSLKYTPDPDNGCLHIEACLNKAAGNLCLTANAALGGHKVGTASAEVSGTAVRLSLKLDRTDLWEPGAPVLYDLELGLAGDGQGQDSVKSYFGMRTVSWNQNVMKINGKPVFQRLVLDQGFYPDGIYTAPDEQALANDIRISMELGFNGARLHQKVFEPRFLYWADKLGYLVWGEHASWGLDITGPMGLERFLPEWLEVIGRDFNHPSIIGWCPFNETWDLVKRLPADGGWYPAGARQDDEVLRTVYRVTKALDTTRPVIDTSGNYHVVTDIFDIHDYTQKPEVFENSFEGMKSGGETYVTYPDRQKYEGQPYFVSEYGGIWWNPEQKGDEGWGYGGMEGRPKSEEEFLRRYEGLTMTLLDNPRICAFCYTQLYDIEQEVNGLYTYDRRPKFKPELIRAINTRKAAIER